jgi:hypothetical protein
VTTSSTDAMILWGHGDIDPQTGNWIAQISNNATNGQTIKKIDTTTFAILDTFGVETGFPSYPTSVWAGEGISCVVCNGVTFAFLKYTVFSGTVAAIRVDTMEQAGFAQTVVSGTFHNRALMFSGKSGGSTASVFLTRQDPSAAGQPSVPLYRIDVTAAATSYDPATWPATNPGITWTTVVTVPVAAIDPAWTAYEVFSAGYDLADGNILWACGTTSSVDGYRLIKLNSVTGAIMWKLTTGTTTADLGGSRINGTLWYIRNPGAGAGPTSSYRIDTIAGTMTTQTISGFFAQTGVASQRSDSDTSVMFYGGTFNAGGNNPIPVAGTSPFSGGWATMGGQTIRTITSGTSVLSHLISLRWSDDRGHSYGNPVTQNIGEIGEYKTSLQWQRLSYARDRVFELSWATPMPTALQGCFVDVTPASS